MTQTTLEEKTEKTPDAQSKESLPKEEATPEGVATEVIDADEVNKDGAEKLLEKAGGEEQGAKALEAAAMQKVRREARVTKADAYDPAGAGERRTALTEATATAGEEIHTATAVQEKKEVPPLTTTEVRDAMNEAEGQGGAAGIEALGELLARIIKEREALGDEMFESLRKSVEVVDEKTESGRPLKGALERVVKKSMEKSENVFFNKKDSVAELRAVKNALTKQLSRGLDQGTCNALTDMIEKQIQIIERDYDDTPKGKVKKENPFLAQENTPSNAGKQGAPEDDPFKTAAEDLPQWGDASKKDTTA